MPSPPSPSALTTSLTRALQSRENRWILRRLPSPANSPSPTSPFTDFNSNDYLSLSSSPRLRSHFLQKLSSSPHVLGSGGSRLLVNGQAHSELEGRLKGFFGSEEALLFNSGFDANVGFFSCVPQSGDIVLFDEYIHASVHDGMRASRVSPSSRVSFAHNCLEDFRGKLDTLCVQPELRDGTTSLFVAVESLYSMDGTFAPLREMVDILEEVLPKGNGYMVVDEAHATGIYGPQGRGRVAELGLEHRVLARLVTFGKALAATGAVLLVPTLIRDYLLNYARSLIYTTSLSYANIVAAGCSFDLLEDGTASRLSLHLQSLSKHLITTLQPHLTRIPPTLLSLPPHLSPSPSSSLSSSLSSSSTSLTYPPSPIIPLHTSHPRPLSAYLLTLGINARPITWPTVPKGKDRVRVCLHAGNTREEVEALVKGVVDWAEEVMRGGVVLGGEGQGGGGKSGGSGGGERGEREEGRMVLSKL